MVCALLAGASGLRRTGGEASSGRVARLVVTLMRATVKSSRGERIGQNACMDGRESWDAQQALVDTDRFGAKSIVALRVSARSLADFLRGIM
jgi:hypothetical protein